MLLLVVIIFGFQLIVFSIYKKSPFGFEEAF